jgi:hypothetical protein
MKSTLMKLFVIGLCVSFFPIQAIAQTGGFTGFHDIESLNQRQCRPSQGFEIILATPHTNPDGCASTRVLGLECSEAWYLPSVAVFLTAFTGGYQIQSFVNGCNAQGYAIVKSVQMNPSSL